MFLSEINQQMVERLSNSCHGMDECQWVRYQDTDFYIGDIAKFQEEIIQIIKIFGKSDRFVLIGLKKNNTVGLFNIYPPGYGPRDILKKISIDDIEKAMTKSRFFDEIQEIVGILKTCHNK